MTGHDVEIEHESTRRQDDLGQHSIRELTGYSLLRCTCGIRCHGRTRMIEIQARLHLDETNTVQWRLHPRTLTLVGPPGPLPGYTARQFAAQLWPPCPICGTTIEVSRINVHAQTDPEPLFITGRWKCPRGCNPIEGGLGPDQR